VQNVSNEKPVEAPGSKGVLPGKKTGNASKGVGSVKNNTSRKLAEETLREILDELEQHIEERTEQLLQANEELQVEITERKRTEEFLQESESRFKMMFNAAPIGIALVDSQTWFVYEANPMFARITGRNMAQKAMTEWKNITHPDDIQEDMDNMARLNAGEINQFQMEKRYLDPTGAAVWVNMMNVSLKVNNNTQHRHLCLIEDITERKQAEMALTMMVNYTRNLIETSLDPIVTISADGKITDTNEATIQMTGVPREDLIGSDFSQYFTDPEQAAAGYQQAFTQGIVRDYPLTLRGDSGQMVDVIYNASVYRDPEGKVLGVFASARDITERRQAEIELQTTKESLETVNLELQAALNREKQLARSDPLTGINNRRCLFELSEHELAIATRYQQALAVIMFDLDHFKQVNDTFGHAVGDQILQRVGKVACANLRSADVIGRYGGDEFIIVLPVTNAQQAYLVADRIRMGVAAIRLPIEKGEATVTLSIGIVELIHHGAGDAFSIESVETLFRRADEAMYSAKEAGGNRSVVCSAEKTNK